MRYILLAVVLLVALAGCTTPSETAAPTPDADVGTEFVATNATVEYLTGESNLEDGERPHGVQFVNRAAENATLIVSLHREDTRVYKQEFVLAENATVRGELEYEANYTLTVEQGGHVETVDLQRSLFDCNASGTTVRITDEGIESETLSTMMYCPHDPPGDT